MSKRPYYEMKADASRQRVSAMSRATVTGRLFPAMYERLSTVFAKLGVDHEIIFVNDASPDNAGEVLPGLKIIEKLSSYHREHNEKSYRLARPNAAVISALH